MITIKYEIHEIPRGLWHRQHGYKVLTFADIPGVDHRVLMNTRVFEGKDAAEAYIEQQRQQQQTPYIPF